MTCTNGDSLILRLSQNAPPTILFFGASVTQQAKGYTENFKICAQEQKLKVIRRGFGAVHLREAVLLLQTAILSDKKLHGSICFLEWLTTGPYYTQQETWEYLKVILDKLQEVFILPCFLYLYNSSDCERRKLAKDYWNGFALKYKVPVIDLEEFGKQHDTPKYFRDMTHLTDDGGTLVGTKLYQIIETLQVPKIQTLWNNIEFIKYTNDTAKQKSITISDILLSAGEIKPDTECPLPIIDGILLALWVIVGQDSPVIELEDSKTKEKEKLSLFDEWCHYDRFMIRRFSKTFDLRNSLVIRIRYEDPPYAKCRRTIVSPPKYQDRRMWLIGWSVMLFTNANAQSQIEDSQIKPNS